MQEQQDTPESGWARTKRISKRIWHFLWVEDSAASWIANIIVAFLLIKFIVYPVLGWALGTSFPIVAVVSESMQHKGTFDSWWESECRSFTCGVQHYPDGTPITPKSYYNALGIDNDVFKQFKFRNGFNRGDLMILSNAKNIKMGDILVFHAPAYADPIIHRVIGMSQTIEGKRMFKTKGDHNCALNDFEQEINEDQVFGKAVIRVPWLGYIKVAFVETVMYARCAWNENAAGCQFWRAGKERRKIASQCKEW